MGTMYPMVSQGLDKLCGSGFGHACGSGLRRCMSAEGLVS